MRKRSLSVACERSNNADRFSKKFEGVASDHDDDASDYEEENDEEEENEEAVGAAVAGSDELWSAAEYKTLVDKLRTVLPKTDKRSHSSRLKSIEWDKVAFDGHSAESVKEQTHSLLKKVRKFRTLAEMLEDVPKVIKKRMQADKPKGPLSSYIHFMKEVYSSYQQRYQTVSSADLVKIIARDYAQLSEKKKAKYERMAAESKKTYQMEMEKYHQEHPDSSQSNKKNRSKAVSRKVTPFNLFCQEQRETGPKQSHAELKKIWNELEMNLRLKYIRAAYSNPDADAVNLTKTEKEMLDKAIGKPDPVGRSCSDYYVKFHAEPDMQIPIIEWRKLKIQEFKSLPKMRRLELELEFRKARAKYVKDYQKYIEALPDRERDKEIQFLQGYMDNVLDKEEKQRLRVGEGGSEDFSRTAHRTAVNDTVVDAHPLAESTTNHFDSPKKGKSKKKDASSAAMPPPPTAPSSGKPLKSILKSPSPVKGTSSNKRTVIEEPDSAVTVQVPKKKQKKADAAVAPAAEPSPVREKKSSKSKSQPEPASNEDNRESSDSGSGKKKQNITPVVNEPRAPPKKLLDYFIQEHYSGKRSKAEEAFNKLSSNRRKEMQRELKVAHKRYVLELEAYFKTLPKHQIEKYLKKIEAERQEESADEDDSDDDNTSGELPANGTKQEPQTSSSSGESDDSDDD